MKHCIYLDNVSEENLKFLKNECQMKWNTSQMIQICLCYFASKMEESQKAGVSNVKQK